MRITAESLREWRRYELINQNARNAYYNDPAPISCTSGRCDDGHLCRQCRADVAADLIVATSVDECAELLALLDLPSPERPNRPCGTRAAYRRHLRHGERACEACLATRRAGWKPGAS